MPTYVVEVIVWTCVGAFVAVVLGGVCALFGWWKPKDPTTGRWLMGSVIIPIVGAVVGFAIHQWAVEDPAAGPDPTEKRDSGVPSAQDTEVRQPSAAPTSRTQGQHTAVQEPVEPTAPGTAQRVSRCAVKVPVSIADWADERLGQPPDFLCATKQPYPTCVAELRQRSRSEVSAPGARECGDELIAFRRAFISPVYGHKATYQDNLDDAEYSLRSPRTIADEDRRSYVVAEISRMSGREWLAFVEADRRSKDDLRACQDERRCVLDDPD